MWGKGGVGYWGMGGVGCDVREEYVDEEHNSVVE